ncbi:unnamed protein product [Linum trigynum]|uniref:Uncharacterized protein n=1 Tax=Linum trigynum TaxID=586398 RepID=A0AAV2FQH0_9ROSI
MFHNQLTNVGLVRCTNRSLPKSTPCHAHEERAPAVAQRKEELGKNLPLYVVAKRLSGSWMILYACLASNAMLLESKSRKPRPPLIYGGIKHAKRSISCHSLYHVDSTKSEQDAHSNACKKAKEFKSMTSRKSVGPKPHI